MRDAYDDTGLAQRTAEFKQWLQLGPVGRDQLVGQPRRHAWLGERVNAGCLILVAGSLGRFLMPRPRCGELVRRQSVQLVGDLLDARHARHPNLCRVVRSEPGYSHLFEHQPNPLLGKGGVGQYVSLTQGALGAPSCLV